MSGSKSGLFEFRIDRCDCLLSSSVQEAVDQGQECVFGQDVLGVSVARPVALHVHTPSNLPFRFFCLDSRRCIWFLAGISIAVVIGSIPKLRHMAFWLLQIQTENKGYVV